MVRAFWLDVHRSIGLVVLALTAVRLTMRWGAGPISSRGDLPLGMYMASRATHMLIYAVLIAMPLLGWAQSSARARHFKLFGLPVPSLVRHNPDLADTLGEAVSRAYALARPSGVVLLAPACASFDMFRDYAERGRKFKEEVKRIAISDDRFSVL